MPEPMPAAIDSTITMVAPLVVGLTWQGELTEGTPVGENGLPTFAALPVPGTITLIDQHGHATASYGVPDLPGELRELATEPTEWLGRVGVARHISVQYRDLALSAIKAMAQVDEWILATAYAPEGWSSANQ